MAKRHVNRVGDLQSMFLRLEELVLANSGEDEFEEVFKLLIAKLWDEKLRAGLFHAHDTDGQTASAVADLLRQANKAWPGVLDEPKMRLTAEHLAICVQALSSHSLANEGLDVMDGFFEFIVSKAQKGAKGQYFTPRHVVEFCVRMMNPKPHETVVDPACGSGGFLLHALNHVRSTLQPAETAPYCESKLWGFDMDARALRVAKALMVVAGGELANFIRLNSLLQPAVTDLFNSDESVLTIEDVCRSRLRRHKGFDVILTNPPFAGEVREKHLLNAYEVAAGSMRIERDLLFIERCVHLLRPGGRMAIVLPHNKFAADSFGSIREWLMKKTRILGVVGLGRHTFLPHTHQKASVLFAQKNDEGKRPTSYDIFFSVSEKDGKDSKGRFLTADAKAATLWERIDHDLGEIHEHFQEFCFAQELVI